MALFTLTGLSMLTVLAALVLLGSYVFDYFFTNRHLIDIPGPFLAKHTRTWLAFTSLKGRLVVDTHKVHEKYGKIVRLQPNFVSVSDDAAIPLIYGHRSKLNKS